MSHTPGPWTAKTYEEFPDGWFVVSETHGMVAEVERTTKERGDVDARLIAAAPDLLEAATATFDAFQRHAAQRLRDGTERYDAKADEDAARALFMGMNDLGAAIAKATGETP